MLETTASTALLERYIAQSKAVRKAYDALSGAHGDTSIGLAKKLLYGAIKEADREQIPKTDHAVELVTIAWKNIAHARGIPVGPAFKEPPAIGYSL